jgi:hypothetical protein
VTRLAPAAAALLVLLLALAGCDSGGAKSASASAPAASPAAPAPAATAARATKSHVVVIVMENKEYGQVIGSATSPYVNALARRYALATRSYGVTHPSLPNYLALTGGSTFGITTNCTDCEVTQTGIADQLATAKLSWKAYMGGMPSACFKGATSGQYAKKHNPFMYYRSVAGNPGQCAKVVPEGRLASDLRGGRLPSFAFLSPGLCDDSHDCPLSTGDRYLSRMVPPILKALGPRGFLVLTWDEGSSGAGCCGGLAKGGRIPMVIAGPGVRRGARLATPYTHYSTLRTIEDALRLPRLRAAADARTASLRAAFRHGTPRIR